MISIIICSRQHDIPKKLRDNIEQTIGVEYELVIIDNADNKYNIFTAYNKGVSLSRYPILLFMHDDILFHTNNWGNKVMAHFKNDQVGGIGISGTPYLSFMYGGWWSVGVGNLHLLQGSPGNPTPVLYDFSSKFSPPGEVVALDGVWFCLRKEVFDKVTFDELSYQGFHFYDLDITLQVYNQGYKLLFIKDILIEHASIGVLDENWINNLSIFQKKWGNILPVSCIHPSVKQQCLIEYRVLNTYISDQLRILNGYGKKKIETKIYLFALKQLLSFRKGYLYFKTPYWIAKLLFQYLSILFRKSE